MGKIREIRVLIVDAQPVMREGLAANLVAAGLSVVADTGDPLAAIEAAGRLRPDVVLLDLALVERHGDWLLGRLREGSKGRRIIVLSSLEDEGRVARALRAGADRHLRKDAFGEELIAAIRGESAGQAEARRGAPLTACERDVLALIAKGRTDAEIGGALDLATDEVERLVSAILKKTGDRGRAQAALGALRRGDISL
jgi:DNA-binding NarL/FixJ family response regulator